MENDWASENLQVIRTLMERSALYRRALAPIMTYVGAVGILGGVASRWLQPGSARGFVILWAGVAAVALAGAFALVRRQALKDSEPFWSPPTRRLACAFMPTIYVGGFLALAVAHWLDREGDAIPMGLAIIWTWLYGCAAVSAGFFLPSGFKYFGWGFIGAGSALMCCIFAGDSPGMSPNLAMAVIFGGFHLAYGIYLYFTEKKNPVA